MSLLQEIKKYGLADCEFNRQLIRNERRITRLMGIYLPVFNDQFEDEYEPLTSEQAQKDGYFYYWLREWGDMDRRGELAELLRGLK